MPKLIEVALPVDVVSRHASREKSIRHGHPSTMHLWWSRKPLAAARAVLFAQLVDDPSARPDLFPSLEAQDAERVRLLDLVGRLCSWEATADAALMASVRDEIAAAVGPAGVTVWDPFAGGGSIPLEGQRLGVPVVASDLNPVAVLLERALLEIPRAWRGHPSVTGPAAESLPGRANGLAADLRVFGARVLAEVDQQLRGLYPKVTWRDTACEVAAYLWVRTVRCGNPACGANVPMLSNPWLRRKQGQEAWLEPHWDGSALTFLVRAGPGAQARAGRGAVFRCVACGTPTTADDVKGQAREHGLGRALRCVVPDVPTPRPFLVMDEADVCPAVHSDHLDVGLDVELDPLVTNAPSYGVFTVDDLHLPRQRAALTAFAAAVRAATSRVRDAARIAGWHEEDATAYARDVTVLLGLVLGRLANRMSTACIWNAHLGLVEQTFIQNNAIAFPWDFAEANPLSTASGSWPSQLDWVARVIERCDPAADALVVQHDVRSAPEQLASRTVVVSTDPPYFDYFLYSSLSDYFYVWLRQALADSCPDLFGTIAAPRQQEIVMRAGVDRSAARAEFLLGLTESMSCIAATAAPEFPITIFYAYRSTKPVIGGPSAWEAFLGAVKAAGLMVTATWPIRTERTEGIKTGTNSLASSIVVACRRRPESAGPTTMRAFLAELRRDVPPAVRRLQTGGIAPVDLAQAAIGPGMAVFTRHPDVIDASGQPMTVGDALAAVNRLVAEAVSGQEGDLDADSRFCLAWFEQYGFAPGPFGTADALARAKNTSVAALERVGVLRAAAGAVRLLGLADLPSRYAIGPDRPVCLWEVVLHLAKRLHEVGVAPAAALMTGAGQRVDLHAAKELAYLLYQICERRGWSQAATVFNGLGTSWNDLVAGAPGGNDRSDTGPFDIDNGRPDGV